MEMSRNIVEFLQQKGILNEFLNLHQKNTQPKPMYNEVAKKFLDIYQGRTRNGVQVSINQFKKFCSKHIFDVNKDDLADYKVYLEKNPRINTISTCKIYFSGIKQFLDWVYSREEYEPFLTRRNPIDGLGKIRWSIGNRNEKYNVEEALEESDVIKLLLSIRGNIQDRLMIALHLSSGCRVGGLSNIEISNINWKLSAFETVEKVSSRNGTKNKIAFYFFSNCLVKHLKAYLAMRKVSKLKRYKTKWLFPSLDKNNDNHYDGMSRKEKRILTQSGVRPIERPKVLFTGTSLRKTFATLRTLQGEDIGLIDVHLNHKANSIAATNYIKLPKWAQREMWEKNDYFEKIYSRL